MGGIMEILQEDKLKFNVVFYKGCVICDFEAI